MNDPTGSDIRRYFEVQFAGQPRGARARILTALRAGTAAESRRGVVRLAAAIAVLVVVAGAIGTITLARRTGSTPAHRPVSSPTAATRATDSPTSRPIPEAGNLILYRPTVRTTEGALSVAGWRGEHFASSSAPVVGRDQQSPDGSKMLVGLVVHDVRTGAQTRLPVPNGSLLEWGDDSRHLCAVYPPGLGPLPEIAIVEPGQPAATSWGSGPAAGVRVLACSIQNDRMLLGSFGYGGDANQLWQLRISQRQVEFKWDYPAVTKNQPNGFVIRVSRDGELVAETDTATGDTVIRHLPDRQVRGRFRARQVLGFSWEGSRVITTARPPGLAPDNTAFVQPEIDGVAGGDVYWAAPSGSRFFGGYLAEPGSEALALAINQCAANQQCQDDLWVVDSQGVARTVDRGVRLLS